MFLKKSHGPRVVRLPNGEALSLGDLPEADTRWVASRKALVVRAVIHGLITYEAALGRYDLTPEELDQWIGNYSEGGMDNLKIAAIPYGRTTSS